LGSGFSEWIRVARKDKELALTKICFGYDGGFGKRMMVHRAEDVFSFFLLDSAFGAGKL